MSTVINLKDGRTAEMRLLMQHDADALFTYLNELSAESKSRFGPHAFDINTVNVICNNLAADDTQRFVACVNDKIKAYMLIKQGLIEWDAERYAQRNIFFDVNTTVTYAPSVADDFQNSGLGSAMFPLILETLRVQGCKTIVLWGGVQATNVRAVHFYEKYGFVCIANFWHDNKDNIDMTLTL